MKNKMPLDGLGLGHDSGSVHCDMLKMLCFRTAWGRGTLDRAHALSSVMSPLQGLDVMLPPSRALMSLFQGFMDPRDTP